MRMPWSVACSAGVLVLLLHKPNKSCCLALPICHYFTLHPPRSLGRTGHGTKSTTARSASAPRVRVARVYKRAQSCGGAMFGDRMARLLILFLAFTQGTSEIPC